MLKINMNVVREIEKINEKEIEYGSIDGSWHDQYKDSAYVFIGNLDYGLTEGDILTVFSQFGEIMDINLVRDKKTGRSNGFCFLQFEDQRSTVLTVDNFNGVKLVGRTIRVDHVKRYKKDKDDEESEKPEFNPFESGKAHAIQSRIGRRGDNNSDEDEEKEERKRRKQERRALMDERKERKERKEKRRAIREERHTRRGRKKQRTDY